MFWRSQKHLENFKNCFCERGYSGSLIDKTLHRVKRKSREELLRPKGMASESVGIPFVVTYHSHFKNISKIIKKHIKDLYTAPDVRSVFTPLPFVSFRSAWNLRSHLVTSNLYPHERKTGNSKCNSPRCFTCHNIKKVTLSPVMTPNKRLK